MKKIKFPSIKDVATELRYVNQYDIEKGEETDIRLQVKEDGFWSIHIGPSDYDLDHLGFWGSSELDGLRFDAVEVARDLVEQAKEQYEMSIWDD